MIEKWEKLKGTVAGLAQTVKDYIEENTEKSQKYS